MTQTLDLHIITPEMIRAHLTSKGIVIPTRSNSEFLRRAQIHALDSNSIGTGSIDSQNYKSFLYDR